MVHHLMHITMRGDLVRTTVTGRGLTAVDVHLLGSVAIVPGARLWTRDKRLAAAGRELGIA